MSSGYALSTAILLHVFDLRDIRDKCTNIYQVDNIIGYGSDCFQKQVKFSKNGYRRKKIPDSVAYEHRRCRLACVSMQSDQRLCKE